MRVDFSDKDQVADLQAKALEFAEFMVVSNGGIASEATLSMLKLGIKSMTVAIVEHVQKIEPLDGSQEGV